MIGERRRPILNKAVFNRVGIVWCVVAILMVITQFSAVLTRRYPDGDDILRLLQVRDWIAGQSWFDVTQYRINPPDGVPMHWTRLVDVPLAAVIVMLKPLVGPDAAELAAAVIIPLITLFLVLLLVGRMAWRLFDDEATGLACLVAAMSTALLNQLRPMRIDHHGWQIVFGLLAVNALMARDARKGGWLAGLAMAVWLAISLEAIPMVMAIMAVGLWRWLRCWNERTWLVAMVQAIFAGSLGIFLLTRGLPIGYSHCDAMSPAILAAMAIAAIGVTGMGFSSHRPAAFVICALGAVGLGALAVALQIAPQCKGGTFAELDPVTRSLWLGNVAEGLPVWTTGLDMAIRKVVPALIGLVVTLHLARRSGDWLRLWYFEYAFMIAVALLLSCFVNRAGAFAMALATVPLGWQLKVWLRSMRNLNKPGKQAAAAAGIVAALIPAAPLSLLMLAAPTQAAPQPNRSTGACDIPSGIAAMGPEPSNLLAPIDLGPRILLDSPHRVLATAHHRAGIAIADNMHAFLNKPEEAHKIIERRKIEYVVLCPSMNEIDVYRAMRPDGLAATLVGGEIPVWLDPVESQGDGVLIWRVVR